MILPSKSDRLFENDIFTYSQGTLDHVAFSPYFISCTGSFLSFTKKKLRDL